MYLLDRFKLKKFILHLIRPFLWILIVSLLPIEKLSSIFLNYYYYLNKLYDWELNPKLPNFFKHLTNLYSWRYKPDCNQFVTAPSIARSLLKPKDRVLDVCCGDGSISYMFFSDIASHIDAIDWSNDAIKYANFNFKKNNIKYNKQNIFDFCEKWNQSSPKYDLIYFGSGFDYFTRIERNELFKSFSKLLSINGTIVIKTPTHSKGFESNQMEHKGEYCSTEEEFRDELKVFFKEVKTLLIHYSDRQELIGICTF